MVEKTGTLIACALTAGVLLSAVELQAGSNKPIKQKVKLQEFQDTQDTFILNPAEIPGSKARIVRTTSSVSVTVRTQDLPPGAYTNWWEVYNFPENCIDECNFPEDVFNPAVGYSVFWAAGSIVDEDGVAYFEASLPVGETPGPPCPAVPFVDPRMLAGCGLLNPLGAQINYILKTHGAPNDDPRVLYRQVGTLGGTCTNPPGPVDHPMDPEMEFQLFPCYDPQVASFAAPDASGDDDDDDDDDE